MNTLTIDWTKGAIRFEDLEKTEEDYLDETGFYAVLAGEWEVSSRSYVNINLLYIGQAYGQSLRQRIPQPHEAYDCANKYLGQNPDSTPLVMVGVIVDGSAGRMTQQIFNDTECCLIFTNQPLCNTQCNDNYTGRPVSITNKGDYWPLKEKCRCS